MAAQQSERPGGGIIDQVHCTVCYGGVLLAIFCHGFHQSSRMESQEAASSVNAGRSGSLEWVPRIEIDLLANNVDLNRRQLARAAEVEEVARHKGRTRNPRPP